MINILYDLQVWTGTVNEPGPYYGFFSGFGSDLGELVIIGSLIGLYKHHNCAVLRCPRLAHKRFEVEGTHWKTCHRHATPYWHDVLHSEYKKEHPDQHKLIKRKDMK